MTAVQIINISTVGDNKQRLLECFDESLKRSDFVITTGGLGPTGDD
ncbi:molybdopterin-binding protein, partial [Clostridioides difficile]